MSYLILMNENARQFFLFVHENNWLEVPEIMIEDKTFVYVLVIAVLLIPLLLRRKLGNLRFFALFGFATVCYVSTVIVVCAFVKSTNDFDLNYPKIKVFKPIGIFESFPLLIFSFTCQPNVLYAFQELNNANPRRMKKVITR